MPVSHLFDEVLFDFNLYRVAAGGGAPLTGWPEFMNTVIKNPKTGVHKTNVNRFDAIEMLTLNIALLDADDRAYLIRFWRGGYGSGVGFRLRVPYDYTAALEVFAEGDGVETDLQLYKTYTRPGVTARQDVRAIVKPVVQQAKETTGFQLLNPDGSNRTPETPFAIQFDGVNQPSGWTANAKTGVVHFTSAPADGVVISWSGEFDIPAAFTGNSLPFSHDVASEAQNVSFREILPAELGIVIT
jgi:hypothetical protein